METVRAYVARMNRPLNATNVGDALGASGVKKGLAQKYLDALVDNGAIRVKDAGKQKVYYATQDDEVLDAEALRAMDAEAVAVSEENARASAEVGRLRSQLRALRNVQSVEAMAAARRDVEDENETLEKKIEPLRRAKANGEVITESERVKIEDAFLKGMEAWLDRRRKFNNLFETVLEGTGEKKQKLWGDIGAETEKDVGIDYDKYRNIYDDLKKQRLADSRAKRMKR
jgi:26S proteasome regulatory subunit (ATPase 3-interacting protein)